MNILLNKRTQQQVNQFINKPSHALGIFAPEGSGKFYTASFIAMSILNTKSIENNTNIYRIKQIDKPNITIDQVREIIKFLKLKHSTGKKISRIVIIENAESMTTDAQNAILKTLEEPPSDSLIIITAASLNKLLPTVGSRLEKITIKPVTEDQIFNNFKNEYTQSQINQAFLIANRRIGLINALLSSGNHRLLPAIQQAKSFLTQNRYNRLIMVEQIIKSDVATFLEALQIISHSAFKQAVINNHLSQSKRWHTINKETTKTINNLEKNANVKLSMTNLVLKI